MTGKGKTPAPPAKPAPPPDAARHRQDRHKPNPLIQPDARWQRSQRYVWDRKGK